MSGFTPGPWRINSRGSQVGPKSEADDQSFGMIMPVAYLEEFDWPDAHEANARLISAAPELLEALELLSQSAPAASCEMFHHEKKDRHTFIEECPALTRYEHACLKARAAIAKARGTPC